MSYENKFYRTNEVVRERSSCPDWLESFAEKLAIKSSVVDEARERDKSASIFDYMSSIINKTKPKYSSVEEAVQDYQKRTGLSNYLEQTQKEAKKKEIAGLAAQIVEASSDENDVEWDPKKKV